MPFAFIGKKAMAHHRAYAVAIRKLPVNYVVKFDEILAKIKMTEVGKRLGSSIVRGQKGRKGERGEKDKMG